ncbi:DUF998 domain-containing protein [Methanobrevibacter filiformis]|uniref:Frag1/DRAM/Sfk1 family protein n=1 Tax=Methanobrevibacter filiformis TaxID=55758 RepID=A0A166EVC6_9EURY|nr:DUF998 domain-containing protein [Methanobrevibacter filiformis]KZX17055.1 hypothetical protein MBFIL_03890 [Methanobrevibacter filiformis]
MNNNLNNNLIKIISLFGLIGLIFYFLHVITGEIFYPNYNPLTQAISDLTALSSPSRNIALLFSLFYGIFTVLFSFGFFIYYKGKINRIITSASFVFTIMTIISFIGYTFFPLSESGYAGSFQDQMHIVVTVFVVIFTITAIILFIIGFFKTKKYKYFGIISLATLILLFTGAMLMNILPNEYFGIVERINVYSIVVFTGLLSLWMYKYVQKINTQIQ